LRKEKKLNKYVNFVFWISIHYFIFAGYYLELNPVFWSNIARALYLVLVALQISVLLRDKGEKK
jgi:hypothetical protein